MITQSSYHYVWVAEMILKQEGVFALVESLNNDHAESKCLGVSHLDSVWSYTATTEMLPILNRDPSIFVKTLSNTACFHGSTFHTGGKSFLERMKAGFFDHRTNFIGEVVEFLETPMSHLRTKSIPILHMFYSCMCLLNYD